LREPLERRLLVALSHRRRPSLNDPADLLRGLHAAESGSTREPTQYASQQASSRRPTQTHPRLGERPLRLTRALQDRVAQLTRGRAPWLLPGERLCWRVPRNQVIPARGSSRVGPVLCVTRTGEQRLPEGYRVSRLLTNGLRSRRDEKAPLGRHAEQTQVCAVGGFRRACLTRSSEVTPGLW
jgi:hypothetical protein